jgi:hypothetical protein
MKPGAGVRRALWSAVIFLVLIGSAVAIRRMVHLVPIVTAGYHPPAATTNPAAARFAAMDDLFARYPLLTLVHIVPGLFFMLLGPLQFSSAIRARHLRWHRLSGRIFVTCGVVIGVSALVMSFGMPAIGGLNQAAATTLFATFFLFALCKAFWHKDLTQRRQLILLRFPDTQGLRFYSRVFCDFVSKPPFLRRVVIHGSVHIAQDVAIGIDLSPFGGIDECDPQAGQGVGYLANSATQRRCNQCGTLAPIKGRQWFDAVSGLRHEHISVGFCCP